MKFSSLFFFVLLLGLNINVCAQKVKTVSGIGKARLEANDLRSPSEVKRIALEKAKVDALRAEFGEMIEQTNRFEVDNLESTFISLSQARTKGEWLKTTSVDYNFITDSDGSIWYTCKVKGKARKAKSKPEIRAYTLGKPDIEYKKSHFKNYDDFFMSFQASVDGYLSIYLDDGEIVTCLFPYEAMDNNNESPFIQKDQTYILFSEFKNSFKNDVNELYLKSERDLEFNEVFVLFSSEPFYKPILDSKIEISDKEVFPRSTSKKEFENWLFNCKTEADDFQVQSILIDIIKE